MTPAELLGETIEAHGGRDRWRRVGAVKASLSSGGLAFQSRGQANALKNLKIEVRPQDVTVMLEDFVRPGWRGTWTPALAAIHDDEARLVEQRCEPRRHFGGPVDQVYWDKLDILTFAGYALWNYLSVPFLIERENVELIGAAPIADGGNLRLDARFAPDVPTHSRRQSFTIDAERRLIRHDYTADPIGRWAMAANLCLKSEVVDGIRFYTRPKVFPRLGPTRRVVPFPTLVWIELDNLSLVCR